MSPLPNYGLAIACALKASELSATPARLTDARIIELRKDTLGRFVGAIDPGQRWGESLAFARAIEREVQR